MAETIRQQRPTKLPLAGFFEEAKILGIFFGILFLLGGVLGFVPSVTKNQMFLGIFMVNVPHNIFHLATGIIFLIASISGAGAARLWFLVSGAIYAIFAILGFMNLDGALFGIISTMPANIRGHAGLGLVMVGIGARTKSYSRYVRE